jgi:YggT family protein
MPWRRARPERAGGAAAGALARPDRSGYISASPQWRVRMIAVFQTIDLALSIYTWIIIGSAIFSWLYAFNVVNSNNRFVAMVAEFLYKATEPALRPLRRILPNLGGLDISPIVLLLIIFFIRSFMWNTIAPALV